MENCSYSPKVSWLVQIGNEYCEFCQTNRVGSLAASQCTPRCRLRAFSAHCARFVFLVFQHHRAVLLPFTKASVHELASGRSVGIMPRGHQAQVALNDITARSPAGKFTPLNETT